MTLLPIESLAFPNYLIEKTALSFCYDQNKTWLDRIESTGQERFFVVDNNFRVSWKDPISCFQQIELFQKTLAITKLARKILAFLIIGYLYLHWNDDTFLYNTSRLKVAGSLICLIGIFHRFENIITRIKEGWIKKPAIEFAKFRHNLLSRHFLILSKKDNSQFLLPWELVQKYKVFVKEWAEKYLLDEPQSLRQKKKWVSRFLKDDTHPFDSRIFDAGFKESIVDKVENISKDLDRIRRYFQRIDQSFPQYLQKIAKQIIEEKRHLAIEKQNLISKIKRMGFFCRISLIRENKSSSRVNFIRIYEKFLICKVEEIYNQQINNLNLIYSKEESLNRIPEACLYSLSRFYLEQAVDSIIFSRNYTSFKSECFIDKQLKNNFENLSKHVFEEIKKTNFSPILSSKDCNFLIKLIWKSGKEKV